MTHAVTHRPILLRLGVARVPLEVVRTLDALVQSRSDVPEAHLVAIRQTKDGPETPTLIVVVAEDTYLATTLARDLRTHFLPPTRPDLLMLHPDDPNLSRIRSLGGELKRGPSGWQWWLLFLGT